MRILVNYHPSEKAFLSQLSYYLKRHDLQALSTAQTLEIGQLLEKAKSANCQAIFLCNQETLANCVPGEKPTLDAYRGSRLNYSVPMIVGNSLTHISKVSHGSWLLEKDLSKFATIHKKIPAFSFSVLNEEKEFLPALRSLEESILIAYDIETLSFPSSEEMTAPETVITCASWSGVKPNGTFVNYVLPLVDFGKDHWERDEDYEKALLFMKKANALSVPKVMHNGLYDCTHSIRYNAEPLNWILDTMALAHAEFSELPKTLDFVASYTLPFYQQWKDESKLASSTKDIQRYWGYNAKDTWYTLLICIEQLRKMPAYAKRNYAESFKLVYPALYCAFEGWKVDNKKRAELAQAAKEKIERNRAELQIMMADPNFNPGSWQQISHYLYKVFGAKNPGIGKSASGTDEKNLLQVGQQHPLLAMITDRLIEYKKEQKAYGTYFTFDQMNGRLLYAINPFGTESGRMSSSTSHFWCGTQVQNIPSYAKGMLVADDDFEICEIDNSQSEARCTAYCSQEEALIAALEDKEKDFYLTLGFLFFQIPYDQVTPFFRNKVIKKVVHGTNYMMGGKTFLENIGATIAFETAKHLGIRIVDIPRKNHPEEMTMLQFAKDLLERYHAPFPRVREWYKELFHEVATTQKLISPLGHVRHFFGDITKNHGMLRSVVAHQPQNLSVSILNKGFWRLYKELTLPSKGKFRLKGQVHDSCKFQYPVEERDFWIPAALNCMTNPVTVHGRKLVIPLEAEYGQNWKDKKPYELLL